MYKRVLSVITVLALNGRWMSALAATTPCVGTVNSIDASRCQPDRIDTNFTNGYDGKHERRYLLRKSELGWSALHRQNQNIWHIFGKDRIWRFSFLAADDTYLKNVTVVNSPSRVYSVSNPAPLVMTNLIIDNSQGDVPNNQSNGLPAGHNTDGFDCSTTDLVIQNSMIHNQDDCLAINKGSNIVFQGNTCINGHGISIGSIASNVVVSGIVISGNTIIENDQALRIKVDATSTNSTISNITHSGNTGTGLRQFGVLIDQSFKSYPSTLKTPGNGVIITNIDQLHSWGLKDVHFAPPMSVLMVDSNADKIAVNCGVGSCQGSWDWSNLVVDGGTAGPINNFTGITGFSND
ncbi:endo-polygalacturonase [Pholiota molesta]|nr:endo-polygalacturonase [Pholiota molesta]